MGKFFGYLFLVLSALTLIGLIAELGEFRRLGLLHSFLGPDVAALVIVVYVSSAVSLYFLSWIAFTLDRLNSGQRDILDAIEGRTSDLRVIRRTPMLRRLANDLKI